MEKKLKGWKEGIIGRDLKSMGGSKHSTGSTVRYRTYKSYPSDGGYRYSFREYHVIDTNNQNLIRTTTLMIDGVELPDLRMEYEHYRQHQLKIKNDDK